MVCSTTVRAVLYKFCSPSYITSYEGVETELFPIVQTLRMKEDGYTLTV